MVNIEIPPKIVSIPITGAGLISLRDLRDLIEATDDVPEEDFAMVLDGELRVEVSR